MKVSKLLLILSTIFLLLLSRLAFASSNIFVPTVKNLVASKYSNESADHYSFLRGIFSGRFSYSNLLSNQFEITNLPKKVYFARLIDANFSSDYLLSNIKYNYILKVYFAHLIDNSFTSNYLFSKNFPESLTKKRKPIKRKLVDDQFINDRNSLMSSFGLASKSSFFLSAGFNNPLANKEKVEGTDAALAIYDEEYRRAKMTNNINYNNIWGKEPKYIEALIAGGAFGYVPLSVASSSVEKKFHIAGYARLHLRFPTLKRFSPEISVAESFLFKFDRLQGFKDGEGKNAFNEYFIKLPLGFYIPFIGWKSLVYLDARYSSTYYNLSVVDNIIINNKVHNSGTVYGAESEFIFRLYLDTPIVRSPSVSEYSHAGFFYMESISPKTFTGNGLPLLLISNGRIGGIFYDMKKDVYKGIMLKAAAMVGYSHIEVGKGGNIASQGEYTNVSGLIYYRINVGIGYEYIFKKNGVGIGFDLGVIYAGYTPFFFATEKDKYSPSLQGDLKYFIQLNLLLGY